jgi:hypothetical protein
MEETFEEVEKIISRKLCCAGVKGTEKVRWWWSYKVRWSGYGPEYDTTMTEKELGACRELLSDFTKSRKPSACTKEYYKGFVAHADQDKPVAEFGILDILDWTRELEGTTPDEYGVMGDEVNQFAVSAACWNAEYGDNGLILLPFVSMISEEDKKDVPLCYRAEMHVLRDTQEHIQGQFAAHLDVQCVVFVVFAKPWWGGKSGYSKGAQRHSMVIMQTREGGVVFADDNGDSTKAANYLPWDPAHYGAVRRIGQSPGEKWKDGWMVPLDEMSNELGFLDRRHCTKYSIVAVAMIVQMSVEEILEMVEGPSTHYFNAIHKEIYQKFKDILWSAI